jgi:hypothetical protein
MIDHILDSMPRAVLWYCLISWGVLMLFLFSKLLNYLNDRFGTWVPLTLTSVLVFGGMIGLFYSGRC